MGHWIGLRLTEPAPNRDAIGAWVEVQAGDRTIQREVTVGGGHASGQLGWIHFGLGRRRRRAGPGHVAGRRGGPVDPGRRPTGYVTIDRGASQARPVVDAGRLSAMTPPTRTARLADVDLPDFGMPAASPELPPALYAERLERLRERMAPARLRPPRRLRRPRAQREPLVPDRLRPAVRGGDPRRRRDRRRSGDPRRQRVLGHGRRRAAADATASCSRTSACRASRATGRGRSPRSSRDEGIGAGRAGRRRRLEDVRPTRARSTRRRTSSTSCGR